MRTSPILTVAALAAFAGCSSSNGSGSNGSGVPPVPSAGPGTASPASQAAALYTETNSTQGNAILAYTRQGNGALTAIGRFQTNGNGTGVPTSGLPFPISGSTGAVTIAPGANYLYAVDAGTNDVAAFSIAASGSLSLIGRYPTGGTTPASITVDATDRYLYVLNSGASPSGQNVQGEITGFTIGANGSLSSISGSTHALSAAQFVNPSEIAFSPDGSYLVVTERATDKIDIYPVSNGVAGAPISRPSSGNIPFGFRFTATGTLVVSNVESLTAPNPSTVSSYKPNAGGNLTTVSAQVPDDQAGACWVYLTYDGSTAYVSNTLSGSISAYTVSADGTLRLLSPGGVAAPQPSTTGPIDIIVTPDNAYLYVLDSNAGASPGTIAGFSIGSNRGLTSISTGVSGLPPGTIGLAVR